MKQSFYIILLFSTLFIACTPNKTENKTADSKLAATTTNSTASASTATTDNTKIIAATPAAEAAQKRSKITASSRQNLTTGYWHIGGAVNVKTADGKTSKGYEGEWFKLNPDQTYTTGKGEKELQSGVWVFQEEETKGFITFESETDKSFYMNEFEARQLGDITLLIGSTPNNKTGTQIKLVRQNAKVIDHNPN